MQRGLGYWQKLAASYETPRLRKIEDGYIYDVLVNGHGVMYGYGERIKAPDDRWAVVSYIRVLQLASGNATPIGANTVQEPSLNTTPGKPAVEPGTDRPINRTTGGDTTVRPNEPAETPATPAADAAPGPAAAQPAPGTAGQPVEKTTP